MDPKIPMTRIRAQSGAGIKAMTAQNNTQATTPLAVSRFQRYLTT